MPTFKTTRKKFNLDVFICAAFALLLIVKLTGDFLPFNLVLTVIVVFGLIIFRYLSFDSIILSRLSVINIVSILFLTHVFLAYFVSDSPRYGFRKLYLLYPIVLVGYLYRFYLVKYYNAFGNSIAFIVGATAIAAPLYISPAVVISILTSPVGGRVGLTENTNAIAIATFFAIGLIHLLRFVNIKFSKFAIKNLYSFLKVGILLIPIVVVTVLMFFTGSRGVQLSIILAYLTYFLFQRKRMYYYLWPLGFILTTLIMLPVIVDIQQLIYAITPDWSHLFIDRRFFNEEASNSINIRFELYQTAWQGRAEFKFFLIIFWEWGW